MLPTTHFLMKNAGFTYRSTNLRFAVLAQARKIAPAVIALSIAVLWVCFLPSPTRAQSIQYTQNTPDQTLRSAMRVDPTTLGLSIDVPLGGYAGRGASLPINLSYSSKQWRLDFKSSWQNQNGSPRTLSQSIFSEWAKAGWATSLDVPVIEWTGHNQSYNDNGNPFCMACVDTEWSEQSYINRIQIHMPGGGSHELRTDDTPVAAPSYAGTYYAVDGSNIRLEATSDTDGTLYLPDGARYVLAPSSGVYYYIDRNGNTLSYSVANRQWTDTLGRVFDVPAPASPSAQTYTYYLPTTSGTPLSYSVRWSTLANALTNSSDALRYQTNMTSTAGDSVTLRSPYLFSGTVTNRVFETSPGGLFNPVVPAEIVMPNGQSYLFTYNVWGEITKVIYPTGAYERFDYGEIAAVRALSTPYAQFNRGVVDRWLSPTGNSGDEVHWHYATAINQGVLTVSTTAPDGTLTERLIHTDSGLGATYGFSDAKGGMTFEERISASSGGAMLRRTLTEWTTSGPLSGGWTTATRNPRVTKQVAILLDTGTSDALTSTTTMSYDDDLNAIATNHYDYATLGQSSAQTAAIGSISAGSLARTEEATFLVNDTNISSSTRTAYRDRNLLSLPTSTRVKDSSGTVVTQSTISYDETSSYPLLTYSSVGGWSDPGTNVRGLPTTVGVWLSTTSSYLQTHAQYDQCGNVRNTWDARGNESQVEYSSTYGYAYPTSAATAVPDSTGVHGSSSALTTSATYDANTGLMTSLTDANGQTTSYSYDSINRPATITRPTGGGSTSYAYGDTPSNLYVRTQTSIDSSHVVEAYQYFDKLGRASRSFLNEGSTYSTTDTQYDSMGRVWRVSNPYRTTSLSDSVNPSGNWTTTAYDYLGRVTSVTTPDSAVVTSAYSGSTSSPVGTVVTVTDQAGKARKSVTDGLGRLTTVYEDPSSLNYSTSYSYDTLNNLTTVTQGSQTRTFAYDSLKRLTSAANPESGTISYAYDSNGNLTQKTDPRTTSGSNWTTTIAYDALNRPTTKTYSNDGGVTPPVNYYYDNASLPSGAPSFTRGYSTGRLVAVTYGSSSSNGDYRGYDELGRVVRQVQQTDGVNYLTEATYYLNSAMATETYPSVPGASDRRTVSYSVDSAARLSSLSSSATSYAPAASVSSISYAAHNALTAETYGNNLVHAVTYNTRFQPNEIKLGTSGSPTSVLDLTYSYGTTGNNGNVQSITYAGGGLSYTQSFTYDALNRLATAQENSGSNWSQMNVYDRYGNRQIDYGSGNYNLAFSASTNRITTSGFSYDSAGNLTNDTIHAYTFDAENKINKVDNVTAYVYDGEGQRVRKLVGENTRFVYGIGGQLVAEYDGSSGNLKKEYVSGSSLITIEPTAVNSNGTRYSTGDNLGTPRVITNSSAGVVSRHDFMPFGEELGATVGGRTTGMGFSVTDGLRQKFTLKERDNETGLDFFEARYYANTQGRFLSVDLVAGSLSNPQSLNRYSYVLNNPLKFIDPTGMIVEWADSEKKKKKDEAEARTSAQRKYENHIAKLLESKKSEERARGERLQESYERLKDSKSTFRVVSEDSGSSSGELTFNGKVFIVSLKGNASEYGAIDTNQKIAHEFEHGRQVLDRELSYHNYNPPDWKSWALDRTDEAKAFAAGFDATPVAPDQGSFLTGMRQAVRTGGIQGGVDYLGRSNTKYRYLPAGPNNVTHRSPAIYEVPK